MEKMENLRIGRKVKLNQTSKRDTYYDMNWKNDILKIVHKEDDGEGLGKIYSFESVSSDREITCSLYGYELELA